MRLRSVFSATLAAVLIWGGAPAALAGTVSADTALTEEAESGARPSLIVAPSKTVLREAANGLELRALLRNPTDAPIAAGKIVYELSTTPVHTSAELLKALEPPAPASEGDSATDADLAFDTLASAEVGGVDAAEKVSDKKTGPREQQITTELTASDLPFTEVAAPGTYVLRAHFTPEGADVELATAATPLVWHGSATQKTPVESRPGEQPGDKQPNATQQADEPTRLDVSFIVPFVLPTNIQTMPTRGQLSDLTPGWDRLLTAAETARATLAIDPRVIAGIRSYGTEAPPEARDFLRRIESTANPSFLLQFADADPAAQAALGFTSLLTPTNLEFVTRFGKFETPANEATADTSTPADDAEAAPADEPNTDDAQDTDTGNTDNNDNDKPAAGTEITNETETPEDGKNPEGDSEPGTEDEPKTDTVPTVEELTEWPGEAVAWPAEGNVDAGTLDLLEASNIEQIVLDSSNVKHTGGPRVDLGDASAIITDNTLGAVAAAALSGETDIDRAAAQAQLTGLLSVRAQAEEGGVVIGLGRAAVADAEDPEQLLEALTQLDAVHATPVEEQATGRGELRAAGPLEPRLALLRTAADREAAVNEVGAVLDHPQYLSGYQRTRLLQLFATRYAPQEGGFDRVATAFRTRDAELLEGVQMISAEHTQLVGVSTSVPIQLYNALPFNATVQVSAQPVSAALEVEQRVFTDVAVGAEANERVLVPVRSRVSSGESGLVVTVAAQGGDPTVFTGTLPLSISSIVETIMLWVLGVAAAWLFVGGAIRSVRKRRTGSTRKRKG